MSVAARKRISAAQKARWAEAQEGKQGRSGDYVLTKQEAGGNYELKATGKTKLSRYLGQRVEVTGTVSASLSTSSDALSGMGSPAPVTLTIISIKTVNKACNH
jgi:hypothetical protein